MGFGFTYGLSSGHGDLGFSGLCSLGCCTLESTALILKLKQAWAPKAPQPCSLSPHSLQSLVYSLSPKPSSSAISPLSPKKEGLWVLAMLPPVAEVLDFREGNIACTRQIIDCKP